MPGVRARVAEVLADQYAASGEARREAQCARRDARANERSQRAAGRSTDGSRRPRGEARRLRHRARRDASARARVPRELALWDRADSLASARGPSDRLWPRPSARCCASELPNEVEVELCERAARLHEDRLGDPIGATPYLERVLALEPSNERAFSRLKDILTAAERWGELEALYDRAARATDDPERQAEMLIEVALICEEIIEDPDKATRYYERILEHRSAARGGDSRARSALREARTPRAARRLLRAAPRDRDRRRAARAQAAPGEAAARPARARAADRARRGRAARAAERLRGARAGRALLEIGTSARARGAHARERLRGARRDPRSRARAGDPPRRARRADQDGGRPELEDERRELLRRIAHAARRAPARRRGRASTRCPRWCRSIRWTSTRAIGCSRSGAGSARTSGSPRCSAAAEARRHAGLKGEILMQVASIYEDLLCAIAERAERIYRRVLELDETTPSWCCRRRARSSASTCRRRARQRSPRCCASRSSSKTTPERGASCSVGSASSAETLLGDTTARSSLALAPRGDADRRAGAGRARSALREHRALARARRRARAPARDQRRRRRAQGPAHPRGAHPRRSGSTPRPRRSTPGRPSFDEFGPEHASRSRRSRRCIAAPSAGTISRDTYEQHLEIDGRRRKAARAARPSSATCAASIWATSQARSRSTAARSRSTRGHQPSRAALEKLLESERRADRAAKRPRCCTRSTRPTAITSGCCACSRSRSTPSTTRSTSSRGWRRRAGRRGSARRCARAFGYAERASAPVARSLRSRALARAPRAPGGRDRQRQAEYVKLLCEVVPEIFDGDVQLAVTLQDRRAGAPRARRSRARARVLPEGARAARRRPERLIALESLYEEAGDAQQPARHPRAPRRKSPRSTTRSKQLLFRRARLLADVIEDRPRAIEVYEQILDLGLERAALTALERSTPRVALGRPGRALRAAARRRRRRRRGSARRDRADRVRQAGRRRARLRRARAGARAEPPARGRDRRARAAARRGAGAPSTARAPPSCSSRSTCCAPTSGKVMDAIEARLESPTIPDARASS